MKQLRLDFPDYSANEQYMDAIRAERREKTDVYMSKVDGIWQALIPNDQNIVINGNVGQELADFCEKIAVLLKNGLKVIPRFRCISNSGIDEYLRKNQIISRRLKNERD